MIYSYRALDSAGAIIKGSLEAENRNLVIESLLRQSYTILELKEDKAKAAASKSVWNINLFEKCQD